MKGLFISYRREDSAPYAGRIYDYVRRTFPATSVFMDVDAVDPGADFVRAIHSNLSESGVVLAVIGPSWESVTDGGGRRRIDQPDDYVARELSTALRSGAHVVPVLVGGARMPPAGTLPPPLQTLSHRNAIEISDTRFAADAQRLCSTISRALGIPFDDQAAAWRTEHGQFVSDAVLTKAWSRFRVFLWTSFALAVALVLWIAVNGRPDILALTLTFDIMLFSLWAWVSSRILGGKNWARVAFSALSALVAVSAIDAVSFANPAQVLLYVATVICCLWTIRLMYTEPIRRWFRHA